MGHVIDGRMIAASLRQDLASVTRQLRQTSGIVPGLAVILVGNDHASALYVRNKERQARAAGFHSSAHCLENDVTQGRLLQLIAELNASAEIHGILVQLPLPSSIDTITVLSAIDPRKDVDGFHPLNAGRLVTGHSALTPCTPLGCLLLIRSVIPDLRGKHAVILGCSNIVGRPLAQLLLRADVTVTIAHRYSEDVPTLSRHADILVAAAGVPGLVRAEWIKPGAVVIDVGINRIETVDMGSHIVGDVAFDEVRPIAGAITPVPGGVGPMTVACLLLNTLITACSIEGMPFPDELAGRLPE